MMSAMDWVNSSNLRRKFIKGNFMTVNISVQPNHIEVKSYQETEVRGYVKTSGIEIYIYSLD